VLHSFNQTDGAAPLGVTVSSTRIFGTTTRGGAFDYGVVFKMDLDGSHYTILHNFNFSDGAYPSGGVVLSGTNLYGMTRSGGSNGSAGTVFALDAEGQAYRILRAFSVPGGDGYAPAGQLLIHDTTLFGSTAGGGSQGWGTIFKLSTDGSG